jgi:Protein of unknown function (DUF2726)
MPFAHLRQHIVRPDFSLFREGFDTAAGSADQGDRRAQLRILGAEAFEVLLESSPFPDPDLLIWFARHYEAGNIEPTDRLLVLLTKYERKMIQSAERARFADLAGQTTIVQLKRVFQTSWFGLAGFEASDAFQIKTSVFRSRQERTFLRAVSERFPGLRALPNYPVDQIIDLNRIKARVSLEAWKSGRLLRLDTVLVTPIEGDPVAAFELDSVRHDDPEVKRRDAWKNELLVAAKIPYFRLRSESPDSTTVDEWFSLLTDEVLDKISVGERLRVRDFHPTLVPMYR